MSRLTDYLEAVFHNEPPAHPHPHGTPTPGASPQATPSNAGTGARPDPSETLVFNPPPSDNTPVEPDPILKVLTPQQAKELMNQLGGVENNAGIITYFDPIDGSSYTLTPNVDGSGFEVRWIGSGNVLEDRLTPTGPAVPAGFGQDNLQTLLSAPGVVGHEFIGNQLIIHNSSGRGDIYRDTNGNGRFTFATNTPLTPGAGFIPLDGAADAGPIAAPGLSGLGDVNAIRGENSTAFNQLSSNLRNLAEGNDPLAATTAPLDPVSQQQALTRFLVDPGGTSAGLSSNTSLGDVGMTLGATPANPTEAAARLRLQGQQVQNFSGDPLIRSRDQSVLDAFGVKSTGDPLADAELVANLRAAQQSRLPAAGGDPITAARLAVQGSGLPVPVNLGGIAR